MITKIKQLIQKFKVLNIYLILKNAKKASLIEYTGHGPNQIIRGDDMILNLDWFFENYDKDDTEENNINIYIN